MMKKAASKLIAAALALVMVLACSNPVFAADPDPTLIDGNRTGTITLTKYDSAKGGKEEEAVVPEAEFSAYRIIGYEDGKYTVVDGKGYEDTIGGAAGAVVGTGTSFGSTDALEAKISALQNKINENKTGADATAVTGANGVATFANLPLGVYLIQETSVPDGYTISSQAFLVSVPQWDNDSNEWEYEITAYPKDEGISVDKKMGEGADKTSDSYSIGDTIPYTVTATIPNYGNVNGSNPVKKVTAALLENEEYDKYNDLNVTFTDTLSKGLTLNMESADDLVVAILNADGTSVTSKPSLTGTVAANTDELKKMGDDGTITGTYDYVITKAKKADGTTEMTVTFSWCALDSYQGGNDQSKKLQLTYSARLNEEAVSAVPNTNDVIYTFKNDPQQDVGSPKTELTPPDTKTYTYQMDLTKLFNGKEPGKAGVTDLSDVTFKLYTGDSVADSSLLSVLGSDGSYTICTDANTNTDIKDAQTELHLDKGGKLSVTGLKEGTYTLKETKSIKEYTLLTAPITFVVEEVKDDQGEVIGTVKAKMGETWLTSEQGNTDGKFALTVNNLKKQFNLPLTGGQGLWMFTIAGGILMAAAIIFFHKLRTRKRKDI